MEKANKLVSRPQLELKIQFLENQIQDLNYFLPETYEFLVAELDFHKRQLTELMMYEYFDSLSQDAS